MPVPAIKALFIENGQAVAADLDLPPARIMMHQEASIAIKIPGDAERHPTSILFNILRSELNRLKVVEVSRWEHITPAR